VLTVNGRVKLVRRWWHSPRDGSLAPADAAIDGAHQSVSPGVREMACRLNNDGVSFDRAAENLVRTANIPISGEQLRLLVLAEGEAVLAAQRSASIPTAFQASDCRLDPHQADSPTRIYTGVDGVMVPLVTEQEKVKRRKKVLEKRRRCGKKCRPLPPRTRGSNLAFKEYKMITFYDEEGRHWHELLSRRSRKNVGALIRGEARRLNFAQADQRVANVDGATWIRNRLQERPDQLPLDGLGLDFYHLSENVHRCRRKVFGEECEAGKTWADELMHTFKHEGYAPAWEQLVTWRATLRSPKKRPAADRLLNYVSQRWEMINYPEFQQRGWQIGSGPTESRCKTSTSRLKGRGRRWNPRNAESVAALTTLMDSHQWHLYWLTPETAKT
jgi:hypothetical protein